MSTVVSLEEWAALERPVALPTSARPSLLADLLAAQDPSERQRLVRAVLHAMGFDWLGFGRLEHAGPRTMPVTFCAAHCGLGWAQRYFEARYHEVDPRLHAAVGSSLPCVWTLDELERHARGSGIGHLSRFVDDLGKTGMHSGAMLVTSRFSEHGVERHVVSLLSRTAGRSWISDAILGQVLTLGYCMQEFYTRYSRMPTGVVPEEGAEISQVQRRILEQVTRGASDKQIAYELNLSLHTVDYHMRQLRRRFGVRNRVQLRQVAARELG